jgi:acetylornithine deacetylase
MHEKRFIQDYGKLISLQTISSLDEHWDQSNKALIEWLSTRLEQLHFRISIQKVPHAIEKYNLLAQIGSGEGGLLLSGHTDTVPFDQGRWNSDPFKLKESDQKLFGLGTCDMKGFFAFIIQAVEMLGFTNQGSLKQKKPLYILATADEETTMAGARFFTSQQLIRPDVAIIGEPTELKPIYKHKGHMAHTISVTGQSGHSSDPDAGVNAIEIMHQAIGALLDLKHQIKRHQDIDFAVPETTLNLGHIHGGDAENRICGHCHLNFDIRPVPALVDGDAVHLIDEHLNPIMQRYPDRISRQAMYQSIPAYQSKNETGIIDLAEKLTGFNAQTANYCTEAPFLNQLGCDTLVLGPGSINQAHQPDEFIDLKYMQPTTELLTSLITRICF